MQRINIQEQKTKSRNLFNINEDNLKANVKLKAKIKAKTI